MSPLTPALMLVMGLTFQKKLESFMVDLLIRLPFLYVREFVFSKVKFSLLCYLLRNVWRFGIVPSCMVERMLVMPCGYGVGGYLFLGLPVIRKGFVSIYPKVGHDSGY